MDAYIDRVKRVLRHAIRKLRTVGHRVHHTAVNAIRRTHGWVKKVVVAVGVTIGFIGVLLVPWGIIGFVNHLRPSVRRKVATRKTRKKARAAPAIHLSPDAWDEALTKGLVPAVG